jgi:hypothetical protein
MSSCFVLVTTTDHHDDPIRPLLPATRQIRQRQKERNHDPYDFPRVGS